MSRHLSALQRALWLLAFLAVVEPFIQWRLSLAYGSLTLPIALLVALMDWLNAPERTDDRDDGYLLVSGLALLLAILSLLLALIVFQLPQLISPDAPTAVGQLMGYGWFVCATAVVWSLLFWRLGFDSRWAIAIRGFLPNPSKRCNPEFLANSTSGGDPYNPAKLSNFQILILESLPLAISLNWGMGRNWRKPYGAINIKDRF